MTLNELYAQLEPIVQAHHDALAKDDMTGNAASSILNFFMAALLKATEMEEVLDLHSLAFVVGLHMMKLNSGYYQKKSAEST